MVRTVQLPFKPLSASAVDRVSLLCGDEEMACQAATLRMARVRRGMSPSSVMNGAGVRRFCGLGRVDQQTLADCGLVPHYDKHYEGLR